LARRGSCKERRERKEVDVVEGRRRGVLVFLLSLGTVTLFGIKFNKKKPSPRTLLAMDDDSDILPCPSKLVNLPKGSIKVEDADEEVSSTFFFPPSLSIPSFPPPSSLYRLLTC